MAADKFLLDHFLCGNLLNPGHYEASAERLSASKYLGGLFYEGYVYELNDFLKDLESSYRMYRVSAYRGYPDAFFRLGWFYSQGIFVEQNQEKAAKYFYVAAKLGVKLAHQNFGVRLKYGNGVSQDKPLAKEFFKRGVELRHDQCFNEYAITLTDTEFGSLDLEEAFQNFRKSAMTFNAIALLNLSKCYLSGSGTSRDLMKAYAIADFGRNAEDPDCTQLAEKLEREISSSDKQQVKEWLQIFWTESINYQHKLAVEDLIDRLKEMFSFIQVPWEERRMLETPSDIRDLEFIRPEFLENYPYLTHPELRECSCGTRHLSSMTCPHCLGRFKSPLEIKLNQSENCEESIQSQTPFSSNPIKKGCLAAFIIVLALICLFFVDTYISGVEPRIRGNFGFEITLFLVSGILMIMYVLYEFVRSLK